MLLDLMEEVNIDLQAVEVIGNNPANGTIKHYRGIYNL
jgi:hypothetical protein